MARHQDPLVIVLDSPVAAEAVAAVGERLDEVVARSDAHAVVCDVGDLAAPDIAVVDVVARLALTARRHGRSFRLCRTGRHLQALLNLAGLRDVLPCGEPSAVGVVGQPEQREQLGCVEEGVEADDSTA